MSDQAEQFKKRILELSERSYRNSQYLFSDFLTEAEQSEVLAVEKDLSSAFSFSGGHDGAERQMVRFGSAEELGYEEEFPIAILKISPLMARYSDTFTHRDYLGAILNQGIDRKVTGDILTDGTYGYLFCEEKIADFIIENLDKIKRTNVRCERVESLPDTLQVRIEQEQVQLSSERIDGLIAHVFKFSRTEATELFRSQKVFVNGRLMENKAHMPKEGDVISVRGYGRFRFDGCDRITRKGKMNIIIGRYR